MIKKNRITRNLLTLIFLVLILVSRLLLISSSLQATDLENYINIPSSPNPVGSGARALGMGGAFIAVADDATAASWNPGGLVQLERPEISVVGAWFSRTINYSFADFPEACGSHTVSETQLNYLSISYPFYVFNKNMIISLNYQHLYDFTDIRGGRIFRSEGESQSDDTINGALSALGIAYGIEIIPTLSLGVTFNIWENTPFSKNQWEHVFFRESSGLNLDGMPIATRTMGKDTVDFSGLNFNFGILWQMIPNWTLGAVFKSPFTADLKRRWYFNHSTFYNGINVGGDEILATSDETLSMPMSYGIGLAYRMSDSLTLSADIYRTEWGDYLQKDGQGNETSPITGEPASVSDIDATHQIRLGAEYLFIKPNKWVIPLRTGLFYDPNPAKGSPDDYYGFSLGSGIAYKEYIFDIAGQYRFGNDVGQSIFGVDSSRDVKEFTVYSSLIIHF